MNITGWVSFIMQEPISGEKMWIKKLDLDPVSVQGVMCTESIPQVVNGGLFAARRSEAELEAAARTRDVQEVQLQVSEQVRDAWYQANAAFRSLDVTNRLVTQSTEALRLAQDRYNAGLGSIVELNEAQLNETSAEITAADAIYAYLSRRAELDFAAGLLN